jgi:hypothetical protein
MVMRQNKKQIKKISKTTKKGLQSLATSSLVRHAHTTLEIQTTRTCQNGKIAIRANSNQQNCEAVQRTIFTIVIAANVPVSIKGNLAST